MNRSEDSEPRRTVGRWWPVALLVVLVATGAALLASAALRDPDAADDRERAGSATVDAASSDASAARIGDDAGSAAARPTEFAGEGSGGPAEASRAGDARVAQHRAATPSPASASKTVTTAGGSASGTAEGLADVAGAAGAGTATATNGSSGSTAGSGGARAARAAADATPRGVTVVVKLAESGRPLAGADVVVTDADGFDARARTTSDGSAVVTVPSSGPFAVEAKSRGRVRVRREGIAVGADGSTVSILLERGVVVQGTVTGPRGPRPAAKVRAFLERPWLESIPYGPDPRPVEETATARSGLYRLDCIPRGAACVLVVEADGCVQEIDTIDPQPDPDYVVRRDVSVEPAVVIEGKVESAAKDGTRTPVTGACVLAQENDPRALFGDSGIRLPGDLTERDGWEIAVLLAVRSTRESAVLFDRPISTLSGADGRFRLALPSDVASWRLLAMHPTAGRSPPTDALVAGARGVQLTLRGRVQADFEVLKPGGKRAPDVAIEPFLPWERWTVHPLDEGLHGTADMDEGVSLGRITPRSEAPGVYVGRRLSADQVIWQAKLEVGVTWSGIVLDDRKVPIAGAQVTSGDPWNAVVRRSTTTGDDGRFVLEGLSDDDDWIEASASGHADESDFVMPEERQKIQIVLGRTAAVRLRLRLPPGAAVPTWRRVSPRDIGTRSGFLWADEFAWSDGVVEWPDWDTDEKSAAVFVPGYRLVVRDVGARPGTPLDLGDVDLVPADRVRGRIVDEQRQPVSGAQVWIRPTETWTWESDLLPERSVDADAQGRFEIDVEMSGKDAELVAAAPGFATTPQWFALPATEAQEVVLGRGILFTARLVDADPGSGWRVQALGPVGEFYASTHTDAGGRIEVEVPLRPRTLHVQPIGRPLRDPIVLQVPLDWAEGQVPELRVR